MLIDHQPSEIIIMIIFINDNSTIRLKGQHAEGDTLALARPRHQKAPLHSGSTAQPSSASVHSNCTHAYTKHTSPHTHTHRQTHTRTHERHNEHQTGGSVGLPPPSGRFEVYGGIRRAKMGILIATAPQRSKGARREVLGYKWV